jgi:hypothetical protein
MAITLFLAIGGSSTESVAGQLRDGAVHHESATAATRHYDGAQARGVHGHEDSAAPGAHQHGTRHEHGTSADHCTHVHGLGLVTSFIFPRSVDMQEIGFGDISLAARAATSPIKHPPRA